MAGFEFGALIGQPVLNPVGYGVHCLERPSQFPSILSIYFKNAFNSAWNTSGWSNMMKW